MWNWISRACIPWPACTHSLYVYTAISMLITLLCSARYCSLDQGPVRQKVGCWSPHWTHSNAKFDVSYQKTKMFSIQKFFFWGHDTVFFFSFSLFVAQIYFSRKKNWRKFEQDFVLARGITKRKSNSSLQLFLCGPISPGRRPPCCHRLPAPARADPRLPERPQPLRRRRRRRRRFYSGKRRLLLKKSNDV